MSANTENISNCDSTIPKVTGNQVYVNGVTFSLPTRPTVAMCLDGTAPEYIYEAINAEKMPFWKNSLEEGVEAKSKGSVGNVTTAFPTLTNTNNCSIMTGQPPSRHGISGNYFFDSALDKAVLMQSAEYVRCDSIFAALANAGVPVTIVTVKDKLRTLLMHQLPNSPLVRLISVEDLQKHPEKAKEFAETTAKYNYEEVPHVYDPMASVYAAQLGAELLNKDVANGVTNGFYYITTTDFIQHMYPPGEEIPNMFYHHIDAAVAHMSANNAVVGVTADHGMNNKCNPDNTPRVVFVEDILNSIGIANNTVLPITDPYQLHHAGMGGSGVVHVSDKSQISLAISHLQTVEGIKTVLNRDDAVETWNMPADRIGDIVISGDQFTTIGKKASDHIKLNEKVGLRSHGSTEEQNVLLYINSPLSEQYQERLVNGKANNYSVMDYILNGVQ